jgi:hypothetical protein
MMNRIKNIKRAVTLSGVEVCLPFDYAQGDTHEVNDNYIRNVILNEMKNLRLDVSLRLPAGR